MQISQLLESNLNAVFKIVWGRRLVPKAKKIGALLAWKYGSKKGRTAQAAVLMKILTYDLTRLTRISLGQFENDATRCYDQIITNFAMVCCMCAGLPACAAILHSLIWLKM